MKTELMIMHAGIPYFPAVETGVRLQWQRKNAPGQLEFEVITQGAQEMEPGDSVLLRVDGSPVFLGYIFTVKYTGQGDTIKITSYDQLRYLKNQHTLVAEKKSLDEILVLLAKEFKLKLGKITHTNFKIPEIVEDKQSLWDILGNAIGETVRNTGNLFVLYDDAGKLCLDKIENMKLNFLVEDGNSGDFSYERSIDKATYNRVRVVVEEGENTGSSKSGKRKIYQAMDSVNISKWGVLQLLERAETAKTAQEKAVKMLNFYDKETRTLTMKHVLGDIRVRAGCSVFVNMEVGDLSIRQQLVVDGVQHHFEENFHFMDLNLIGGVITG